MPEVTKAEALRDKIIAENEDFVGRLPAESEFKLHTSFLYPEGKTYSGEAVQCSGYGFFKGAEVSSEDLYRMMGSARDKIKDCGGVPLKIELYLAPVQKFRRKFYEPSRDWRPVKVIWTFHGSPIVWMVVVAIALAIPATLMSIGFLLAVVKTEKISFTAIVEAAKKAAEALPKTAKWLAIGAGMVALLALIKRS